MNEICPVRQFCPEEAARCWICVKLLKWLETKHPKLAESCHIWPLSMEFSIYGFIIIKNNLSGLFTFELDMNVGVEGFGREFDLCQVGVYLVPVPGVCSLEGSFARIEKYSYSL
jgi:hypothetical protein